MKENVIDVLMFLFDNYLSIEENLSMDERSLTDELEDAGFHAKEISKAFDWLDELSLLKKLKTPLLQIPGKSVRIFSSEEQTKLSSACRGFLMGLEVKGLLDASTREIIIDRAMAIESGRLNLQQFKRILGLILLNSAENEDMLVWLEELIYDEESVRH
ncbi:MAG: DUF494 family protein [Candidatus Berkiellales bacterium]